MSRSTGLALGPSLLIGLLLPTVAFGVEPDRCAKARAAIAALRSYDGSTPARDVGAALEGLGTPGGEVANEVDALVALIEERSRLLRGRDAHEVIRLRSLALATIARLGPTTAAAPLIAEQLDESVDPRAIAAAARAFAFLPGEKRWGLRPLLRAFQSTMGDVPLCLDRFDPRGISPDDMTTLRLEIVAALRSLGPAAREAVPLLEAARRSSGPAGSLQERLSREASAAIAVIASGSREAAADPAECPECVRSLVDLFVSPWQSPADRPSPAAPTARLTDQNGRRWNWRALIDRPTAVTFFYARCQNPNRCERTMAQIAALRKRLERESLRDETRILCVTLEPEWDTPEVLKEYALAHHITVDAHLLMLRPETTAPLALSDALNVPVNRSGSQVNTHGTAIYLLDSQGRVARTYRSLQWDPADVARDLKRLRDEPSSQRAVE